MIKLIKKPQTHTHKKQAKRKTPNSTIFPILNSCKSKGRTVLLHSAIEHKDQYRTGLHTAGQDGEVRDDLLVQESR